MLTLSRRCQVVGRVGQSCSECCIPIRCKYKGEPLAKHRTNPGTSLLSLGMALTLSLLCFSALCVPAIAGTPQESATKNRASVDSDTSTEGDRRNVEAKKSLTKKATRPNNATLTTDQQTYALEFARQHHPELANLLVRLQRSSPSGFARGIRDVHSAAERIERVSERQPARREAELKKWKIDSEVRLLTAKWVMSQDPKLEERIQQLLRDRHNAKIDRLHAERDKLAERLHQLDKQIGMSTSDTEAILAAEWQRLTKQATAATRDRIRQPKKPPIRKTTAK